MAVGTSLLEHITDERVFQFMSKQFFFGFLKILAWNMFASATTSPEFVFAHCFRILPISSTSSLWSLPGTPSLAKYLATNEAVNSISKLPTFSNISYSRETVILAILQSLPRRQSPLLPYHILQHIPSPFHHGNIIVLIFCGTCLNQNTDSPQPNSKPSCINM